MRSSLRSRTPRSMSSRWSVLPWPATLVGSSLAVALVVFGGFTGPARVVVTLWFLAVCPGMALVGLLDIDETAVRAVLAVSISLTLAALVSIIGLYVGGVGSEDVLVVLIAITV